MKCLRIICVNIQKVVVYLGVIMFTYGIYTMYFVTKTFYF